MNGKWHMANGKGFVAAVGCGLLVAACLAASTGTLRRDVVTTSQFARNLLTNETAADARVVLGLGTNSNGAANIADVLTASNAMYGTFRGMTNGLTDTARMPSSSFIPAGSAAGFATTTQLQAATNGLGASGYHPENFYQPYLGYAPMTNSHTALTNLLGGEPLVGSWASVHGIMGFDPATNGAAIGAAQLPALSGDVTTSPGSATTSLADNAVNNFKLANVPTGTIKGRASGGLGDPEDLSAAQVAGMVSPFMSITNAADSAALGGIPASQFVSGSTNPIVAYGGLGGVADGTYAWSGADYTNGTSSIHITNYSAASNWWAFRSSLALSTNTSGLFGQYNAVQGHAAPGNISVRPAVSADSVAVVDGSKVTPGTISSNALDAGTVALLGVGTSGITLSDATNAAKGIAVVSSNAMIAADNHWTGSNYYDTFSARGLVVSNIEGNLSLTGTVAAASFSGAGSGLTALDAGNMSAGKTSTSNNWFGTFTGSAAGLTALPVAGINASGTPSASTVLFGNGTWAVPSTGTNILALANSWALSQWFADATLTNGTILNLYGNLTLKTGLVTAVAFQVATNSLATAGIIDAAHGTSDFATNASFTLGNPINMNPTNYNTPVLMITNYSGTLITITPAPAWKGLRGTWNCTNVSVVSLFAPGTRWTNAICTPLW